MQRHDKNCDEQRITSGTYFRLHRAFFLMVFLVALGALSMSCVREYAEPPLEHPVKLEFVGEVDLADAKVEGGIVRIPLSFKGGYWEEYPDTVVARVDSYVAGNTIFMTVVATERGDSRRSMRPAVLLAGLQAGEYNVMYQDPDGARHRLGSVRVPRNSQGPDRQSLDIQSTGKRN